MEEHFQNLISTYKKTEARLIKKNSQLVTLRSITALLAIAALIIRGNFILLFVPLVCLFIYFLVAHGQVRHQLDKIKCKIKINERILARYNGHWADLKKMALNISTEATLLHTILIYSGRHRYFNF